MRTAAAPGRRGRRRGGGKGCLDAGGGLLGAAAQVQFDWRPSGSKTSNGSSVSALAALDAARATSGKLPAASRRCPRKAL
ncbi:hypothetical protein HK414_17485 [Ramlibacter terrae]|uniref:Uncharacterized protein n=1 Tax=Ramlibacter terrae TaxID=2732511 RepID=A0ABX6P401_9BURK|nr:hypothetical protein HK414_17485 [Ramlibacter terrae]